VTVTDTVDTTVVPPALWSGTGRLQSRTFIGAAGSPRGRQDGLRVSRRHESGRQRW
jgi:hypothetical protein